ncbi:MAG: hypothetical protein AAFP16_19535 [Pseudomonadota bacterium]
MTALKSTVEKVREYLSDTIFPRQKASLDADGGRVTLRKFGKDENVRIYLQMSPTFSDGGVEIKLSREDTLKLAEALTMMADDSVTGNKE